jgi:hypothetical protein
LYYFTAMLRNFEIFLRIKAAVVKCPIAISIVIIVAKRKDNYPKVIHTSLSFPKAINHLILAFKVYPDVNS